MPAATVFFLSDYGTRDEFAGVVRAVLTSAAPGLTIIDLTHHIPPFDVRAGSRALVRAAPYLGPGVVLGVVDPGVGSPRRALCVPVVPTRSGPSFFVGPDNGLLVAAAELVGQAPIAQAFALTLLAPATPVAPATESVGRGTTFDGRDLFAPAAAALCRGISPEQLGHAVDPDSLVRLRGEITAHGRFADGRRFVRTEVLWIDHFGNVQLAATTLETRAGALPHTGAVGFRMEEEDRSESVPDAGPGLPGVPGVQKTLRRVETFADLDQDELGLLVDSNGHWAVVAGEASAARSLGASPGDMVVLTWETPG
jgi:S-adenosylmethionine hydrolase